jgi:hypothetical protein
MFNLLVANPNNRIQLFFKCFNVVFHRLITPFSKFVLAKKLTSDLIKRLF